jgi:hypothetical protein
MKKIHLEIDIKTVDNSKLVNGYEKISHLVLEIDPIKFNLILEKIAEVTTNQENLIHLIELNERITSSLQR